MKNLYFVIALLSLPVLIFNCRDEEELIYIKDRLDSLDYEIMASAFEYTLFSKYDSVNYDTINFETINENYRLIIDSTFYNIPKPWLVDKHKVNYPEDDYLIDGLNRINSKAIPVDSTKFKTRIKKVIISRTDIKSFIDAHNNDLLTYNSDRLSIPFLDQKNRKAVILKTFRSRDQTIYEYIWLKRTEKKWLIYDRWHYSE